jgi:hypothetical protein
LDLGECALFWELRLANKFNCCIEPKQNQSFTLVINAQNSNNIQLTANANFINFYNQVPFLRKANQGGRPQPVARRGAPQRRGAPKKEGKEEEEKEKKDS